MIGGRIWSFARRAPAATELKRPVRPHGAGCATKVLYKGLPPHRAGGGCNPPTGTRSQVRYVACSERGSGPPSPTGFSFFLLSKRNIFFLSLLFTFKKRVETYHIPQGGPTPRGWGGGWGAGASWGELGELGEFASFPPGRGAAGGQPASQGPNELAPSRGNLANSPNPPNSPRGDALETSGGG